MFSYIYKRIYLDDKGFHNFKEIDGVNIKFIDGLSRINIFVGPNNSGKSRFLREVFNYNINKYDLLGNEEGLRFIEYGGYIILLIINILKKYHLKELKLESPSVIFNDSTLKFGTSSEIINSILTIFPFFSSVKSVNNVIGWTLDLPGRSFDKNDVYRDLLDLLAENEEKIEFIKLFDYKFVEFKKIYLPILRGLNNFDQEIFSKYVTDLSRFSINIPVGVNKISLNSFYEDRIRKMYNLNIGEIFTGQDLYYKIKSMLLGSPEERQIIAGYEIFLSKELFNGEQVSLLPKETDDVLTIKIGKEEKIIYNLGDGIQSLILLTFPLFQCSNGIFFIEEPEINLHPGLQRKFIEILLNSNELKDRNHQYFLTTHSNHFLDLTFDYSEISIFRFSTENSNYENKIIEQISNGDEGILYDLGVKNSSVFLSNASIWVEGITDRLYVRKFLSLYIEKNNLLNIVEDVDYSFVEYGGANITHWLFNKEEENGEKIKACYLCSKALVISDKDFNKDAKHIRLKKELGENYIIVDGVEIENLLSLETIIKVIKSYKRDESFVFSELISKTTLKNEKIGSLIDKSIKPNNKYSESKINGSLKSSKKLDFCKKAVDILKYEEMTSGAIKLSEKIYNFIVSQRNK